MKIKKRFLTSGQHGGMLVELMMTIALAAIIIPFVFRYQQTAIERARNITVKNQMESVQNALERYIFENKTDLMRPTGKNIVRIRISDLVDYGLPEYIAETYRDDYQIRVLKAADKNNKSVLQGIVILSNSDITPLRTREIVNLGGGKFGFIEGNMTHGGFGAFRVNASDFGILDSKGLVGITPTTRGDTEYLWRLPSEQESDATMLSALNLDGHPITNVGFFDATKAQFEEKLKTSKMASNTLTFNNRINISSIFATNTAVVNGAFTSDSRSLTISETLSLADSGKFSSFYTNDLYVNNLTLNGFTVSSKSGKSSTLRIVGDMDMVLGRINATYVSVGHTGSVTPQLTVTEKIQDSKDSSFYWDAKNKQAHFADASFPELSRMASLIIHSESIPGTSAAALFGTVASNANATVGDYMNAINEIQEQVRIRYEQLNLK